MRFSLSTLLLTVTMFAIVCSWFVDRRQLRTKLEEEAALGSTLASATFGIMVYAEFGQLSPEEFERKRQRFLLLNILYLAQCESFEAENQQGICLMHAGNSLSLLECGDLAQVREMVSNAGFVSEIESAFLNPANELYDDLADFITRAFARLQCQPTHPVLTWLEAVEKGDLERLETAFSKRIRQQSDDKQWKDGLKKYQETLATKREDYARNQFSFEYVTSLDQEGQVTVFRKRREVCTLQIIKEDKRWKIDER